MFLTGSSQKKGELGSQNHHPNYTSYIALSVFTPSLPTIHTIKSETDEKSPRKFLQDKAEEGT